MISTILLVVAIITVLVIFFYIKGRNKTNSEKGNGEKISEVIVSKFKRTGKNLANSMRDLEWLKTEAFTKLDNAKNQLQSDYKTYLTDLVTSRESLSKLSANIDIRINDLISKAKKYKDKFALSSNPTDKDYADKYISQVISLQKNKSNITNKLNTVITKISDAEPLFEYQLTLIEVKRVEILDMTCIPDTNTMAKLADVNSILDEFKEKITIKNIDNEVKTMMKNNTSNSVSPTSEVSTSEIEEFYNSL